MIEALMERALHAALCRALEQSLQEAGLPPDGAKEMCSRLLTHTLEDEEQTDAASAAALGVEDEEDLVADSPALPVPPKVRIATRNDGVRAEPPAFDELVAWMVPALEDGATWADIARAAGQGHDLREEAMRGPDRL